MGWLKERREKKKAKKEAEIAAQEAASEERLFRIQAGIGRNEEITMEVLKEAYRRSSLGHAFAANDAFQAGWQGNLEANKVGNAVAEAHKDRIHQIQARMVELMSEGLHREITRTFCAAGFDVLEFIDADSWHEPIIEIMVEPIHYLKHGTVFPSLPDMWESLSMSGGDILIWLFECSSVDGKSYGANIGQAVNAVLEEKVLLGHDLTDQDIFSLSGLRLVMPFVSNDTAAKFNPLLAIYNEVEGGKELIESCIREADKRGIEQSSRF